MSNMVNPSTSSPQQISSNQKQRSASSKQNVSNFNNILLGQSNPSSSVNPGATSTSEPKDAYYSTGYKFCANCAEDSGAKALQEEFSGLKSDRERSEFVGQLFDKAGNLTSSGEKQMLGHNLNGALNMMDGSTKTQFSQALNQAYNNGAISKEDLAAVLSDESLKSPGQVSKTPTGSVARIVDVIQATGNDKLMGDSFSALWSELTTDKDVDLNIRRGAENAGGDMQERFVNDALDLALEMQKHGNDDGIMTIVDTFNNLDASSRLPNTFFQMISQLESGDQHAACIPNAPDSGKLDEFIRSLDQINPTPASGAADATGINDRIENTIQRLLPHIEKGDHHSINAISSYLLNGTTKDANGNKDFANTHLQRFLSESTQSAGTNGNETDDTGLLANVIRQTILNQGDLEVGGAVNLANALGELTQQKLDKVNDLDLTSAERKQSAAELGTLVGSLKAAANDKLKAEEGMVGFALDWIAWIAPGKLPYNVKKPAIDAVNVACEYVKELSGAAVGGDTAEIRNALEKLTGFEDKVIDTTAANNQPIERITDVNGNLTEPVKTALGTPEAETLDDLTDNQRFQLQRHLDAQETTQEIPSVVREAINRITDSVYLIEE